MERFYPEILLIEKLILPDLLLASTCPPKKPDAQPPDRYEKNLVQVYLCKFSDGYLDLIMQD